MRRDQYLAEVRKVSREEEDWQIALVEHLRWRIVPGVLFWHTPNGGKRSKTSAARLKAMGALAGVHDLIFLSPGPKVFTLECKFGRNKMTDEQEAFAMNIERIGGEWACAWSIDQALTILEAVGIIKPEAALQDR